MGDEARHAPNAELHPASVKNLGRNAIGGTAGADVGHSAEQRSKNDEQEGTRTAHETDINQALYYTEPGQRAAGKQRAQEYPEGRRDSAWPRSAKGSTAESVPVDMVKKCKKVSIALPGSDLENPRVVEPGRSSNEEVSEEEGDDDEDYLTADQRLHFDGEHMSIESISLSAAPDSAEISFPDIALDAPVFSSDSSSSLLSTVQPAVEHSSHSSIDLAPKSSHQKTTTSPSSIPKPRSKFQQARRYVTTPRKRQVKILSRHASGTKVESALGKLAANTTTSAHPEAGDTSSDSASPLEIYIPNRGAATRTNKSDQALGETVSPPIPAVMKAGPIREKPNLEDIPPAPPGEKTKKPGSIRRAWPFIKTPETPMDICPETIVEVQEHSSGPSAEVAYAGNLSRRRSYAEGERAHTEYLAHLIRFKNTTAPGKGAKAEEAKRWNETLYAEGVATGDFLPAKDRKSTASGGVDVTHSSAPKDPQLRRSALSAAANTLEKGESGKLHRQTGAALDGNNPESSIGTVRN
ncbi:hypothetical protein MBLNU459_g4405t3 [Dothideomycetes sp. NU459]